MTLVANSSLGRSATRAIREDHCEVTGCFAAMTSAAHRVNCEQGSNLTSTVQQLGGRRVITRKETRAQPAIFRYGVVRHPTPVPACNIDPIKRYAEPSSRRTFNPGKSGRATGVGR